MRKDLDALMEQDGLDALWVCGSAGGNPALDYFVGRAHLDGVHLVKKRGEPPLLLHGSMERDEAASTGLRTAELGRGRYQELVQQNDGNRQRASALMLVDHLHSLGVSGRVAAYGTVDVGWFMAILNELQSLMPDIEWVPGSPGPGVIERARMTKDSKEIERIRRIGGTTIEVVEDVRRFLQSHDAQDGCLVTQSGQPLTVADVKSRIHRLLAEREAESPSGPIFAQAREAAIGHSVGRPEAAVMTGATIVFDIYPRELGGGYYFDFTRTWCLEQAPAEAQALYDDVKSVYDAVFPLLEVGASTRELQQETCHQFEALGHATLRSDPATRSGYIHGLAHGLGLAIHEPPSFRHFEDPEQATLEPGMVFTFEPGLYYPERGMGVRLEDTVYVREDGSVARLVEYPLGMLVPLDPGAGE